MLDAIAINRRHGNSQPFTIGHLAECLLFYGQVNVVVSTLEMEHILRKCNIDTLITLLNSQALKLHVNYHAFGSSRTEGTSRLNMGFYSNSIYKDVQSFIYRNLHQVYRSSIKCIRYTDRLAPLLSMHQRESSELISGFLLQEDFTTKAFREAVKRLFPDYPIPLDLRYKLYQVDRTTAPAELTAKYTYEVDTNFNTTQFEHDLIKYKQYINPSVGVDFLLQVASAVQDIHVAGTFKSEISANEDNIPIIQNAILNLDQYEPNNGASILQFEEHVLNGCPSVAEAIDSGYRTFDDFMHLFEQSQRFRDWLRSAPDDSDHTIVNEYLKACETSTFTDSLFFKLLKFVVVSAPIATHPLEIVSQPPLLTDAVNLVTGPIIDEVVSHLTTPFDRWKPNQYVKQTLVPFLKGK